MRKIFTLITLGLVFSQLNALPLSTAGQESSVVNTSTVSAPDLTSRNQPGIESNAEALQVRTYPNPVNDRIQFVISDKIIGHTIRIYNLLGSEIASHSISNAQESVDVSVFDKGLYLYRVMDRNQKTILSGKFNKL